MKLSVATYGSARFRETFPSFEIAASIIDLDRACRLGPFGVSPGEVLAAIRTIPPEKSGDKFGRASVRDMMYVVRELYAETEVKSAAAGYLKRCEL